MSKGSLQVSLEIQFLLFLIREDLRNGTSSAFPAVAELRVLLDVDFSATSVDGGALVRVDLFEADAVLVEGFLVETDEAVDFVLRVALRIFSASFSGEERSLRAYELLSSPPVTAAVLRRVTLLVAADGSESDAFSFCFLLVFFFAP